MSAPEKIVCEYCKKEFRRFSVLAVHLCEPKRRALQENETGVRLGFAAYLQFCTMAQGSAKTKTYKDFANTPYYSAFVKFGQYLVQIRAINTKSFTEWVIRENKKLDSWTKDEYYESWLYDYLRKEHSDDALTRSFSEMQRWADELEGREFQNFFRDGSINKISMMISNGRISPWVIYNSASGIEFFSKLDNNQISRIYKFIDPEYWQRKFSNDIANTEFIKMVLKEANI